MRGLGPPPRSACLCPCCTAAAQLTLTNRFHNLSSPPLAQECDNDPETGIFLTLFQGKCYPECADAGCSPDSCEDSSKCTACSTGYARKGRKW